MQMLYKLTLYTTNIKMSSASEQKTSTLLKIIFDFFQNTTPSTNLSEVDLETAPFLLLPYFQVRKHPVIVVTPDNSSAEQLTDALRRTARFFGKNLRVMFLPEYSVTDNYQIELENELAVCLEAMQNNQFDAVIGSLDAFAAPQADPRQRANLELELKVGQKIKFSKLAEKLIDMDYDDEFEVKIPGEFSRRGGIIDIFSAAANFPCRIEFWGDEIDSMRAFNVESQRSETQLASYRITPRSHGNNLDLSGNAFSYIEPAQCQIIELFPAEIANSSPGNLALLKQNFFAHLNFYRYREENCPDCTASELHSVSAVMKDLMPDEITSGGMELIRKLINTQLHQYLADGYRIFIQCKNDEAEQNIREYLKLNNFKLKQFTTFIADLPNGVICPADAWLLLTEKELFTAGVFKNFNATSYSLNDSNHDANSRLNTNHGQSEFVPDLEEGDYVVHINHGIARFRGLKTLTRNKAQREVMVLEYQDNMLLYVPVYQAAHISKYIGSGGGRVTLHRLDGRKWSNDKKNAGTSIRAYAADLLRLQAVRQSSGALPCPEDNLNMRVFENNFAFEPTPDQRRAADEIKHDLSGPRPMDRLLCGDVGYGKTEVALRAVFKMADAGYQVAILAPTTILAQQHFLTFQERFAEYPYTIEVLSRFKTPLEQRKIIENLKSGGIDIIIGTHRLCQDDIGFKNLGLVVIDEEQRFGVKHKERIRRFRTEAHVLTMSATPIPRTLYMAMGGARDLSTIMSAPTRRKPIKTLISLESDQLIEEAIRNEVRRGGQVFLLHNRVKSINARAEKLMELMPDIRFAVGHGQQSEEDLELTMQNFLAGKIDVLISTTIIESGLDIPNANTIIIERADRFGLAELYQLRGRVGRWKRQAYAYLLLPKDNVLTSDARKRIGAIRRYTHLGAGFQLALRDLEIRGAGNLLGAEQSGHINLIGFELYCQMLKAEVARMKFGKNNDFMIDVELNIEFVAFCCTPEENMLSCGIPVEYIPSERLRIAAYRQLSALSRLAMLEDFRAELIDRYGQLPPVTENLLQLTKLRIMAAQMQYEYLAVVNNVVTLKRGIQVYRKNGMLPRLPHLISAEEKLSALTEIMETIVADAPLAQSNAD